MSNSCKVGEIFSSAGQAFNTLGELTMQLSSAQQNNTGSGAKWTEEEIEMLHNAVRTFAGELNTISETIKQRTVQQIKGALKKRAFEDAGIPLQTSLPSQAPPTSSHASSHASSILGKSADVTLNMLNASESEVDVEGLGHENRLDFDSSGADVKM